MAANNATALDIQNRIVALCALIDLNDPVDLELGSPTTSKELGRCNLTDEQLPLFEVKRNRMLQSRYESNALLSVTREFYIRLYVARLCEDDATNETCRALASQCELPVLRFFAQNRCLPLAGTDNGLVHESLITADTGDVRMGQGDGNFAGVMFRMQTVTRHNISR